MNRYLCDISSVLRLKTPNKRGCASETKLLNFPARIANESLSMRYLTCFRLKSVEQALICLKNITIEDPSANCKRIAVYAISHVFYVKKRQTSVDLHQKRNYCSSLRELQMNRYLCDILRVLR